MKIKELLKEKFQWLLKKMVYIKIYIQRTTGWMGIANSIMLVFLVMDRLNALGVVEADLGNSLIIVVFVWFLALVFLGWMEVEILRAPHLESNKMIQFNPPMKHIYDTVNKIDKKLNEIEKRLEVRE